MTLSAHLRISLVLHILSAEAVEAKRLAAHKVLYAGAESKPPIDWWKASTLGLRWNLNGVTLSTHRQGQASELAKGFQNAHNSCYMAAALQMMLHLPGLLSYMVVEGNINTIDGLSPLKAKKMIVLLQDIQELYERIEGSVIPSSITATIRSRLIEIGMPVDGEDSQEDASGVLLKIMEAFLKPPGLSRLRTEHSVKQCEINSNSFVRLIPGLKWSQPVNIKTIGAWRRNSDGSCGTRKVNPPTVANAMLPDPSGGSFSIPELLKSEKRQGTLSKQAVDDLYDASIDWVECNYKHNLTDRPFTKEDPKPLWYCDSKQPSRAMDVSLYKVRLDGAQTVAIYRFSEVTENIVPDEDLFMLQMSRFTTTIDPLTLAMVPQAIDIYLLIDNDGIVELPANGGSTVRNFQLKACTIHGGHLGGGHWTAAVRMNDGRWMNFDDDVVSYYADESEAVEVCRTTSQFLVFEKTTRKPSAIHGFEARTTFTTTTTTDRKSVV